MANITRIVAGAKGNVGNTKGSGLASSVNASLDLLDSGISATEMSDQYLYKGFHGSGVSLNQSFEDGTYTVSQCLDGPPEISSLSGKVENSLMRVTLHGNNWQLQEIFPMARPEEVYFRVNRPLLSSGAIFNEWTKPKAAGKFYKKKVAFMGDSITANYNMVYEFAQLTGALTYNYAIGGTRLGFHNDSGDDGYDDLSGYKLAAAINSGLAQDWDVIKAAGVTTDDTNDNTGRMIQMADQDWSEIEYLVIGFGTNDCGGSLSIGTDTDTVENQDTFYAALNSMIPDIISAYPHLKILWWLPLWTGYTPTDPKPAGIYRGSDVSPNLASPQNHMMSEYLDAMKIKLKEYKQAYINLYETSGITEETKGHYLISDMLHPTAAGVKRLAEKIEAGLTTHF